MATSKLTEREPPVVVSNTATIPQRAASRLPSKLRFPILVLLHFGLKNLLWSTASNFLPLEEFGLASKIDDDDSHAVMHLAYYAAYLWFTWKGNYDWMDVAALTTLTSVPYGYLLNTYYNVSATNVLAWTTTEVASIAFPMLLLRPLSKIHKPNAKLRNRFLLESFQVQTSTSLLAVGVYVTVFYTAVQSGYLNSFLISHFDVSTVEAAYAETPLSLAAKVLPIGVAARAFLLNPSIGAQTGTATPVQYFDGATATLPETIQHNFWFFGKRTRTLIRQTAIITAFMISNTVHKAITLRGSDVSGAAGYAGLWALATAITSAWWSWVGDTEDLE